MLGSAAALALTLSSLTPAISVDDIAGPADAGALAVAAQEHPFAVSRDCVDLKTMAILASIAGTPDAREINGLRTVACALGLTEPVRWGNGVVARTTAGAWTWPSGAVAKSGSGTWSWPSGTIARSAAGSWSWPDASPAVSTTGRVTPRSVGPAPPFSMVSSSLATERNALLATACAKGPAVCRELPLLRALDADLAAASLMSLFDH